MTLIESLKKQIDDLDALIKPLANKRAELRQKLIEAKSKFAIGDIITWNEGTRKGRIIKIKEWCCGDPMWEVRRLKLDGTEGELSDVYSWKNPVLSK